MSLCKALVDALTTFWIIQNRQKNEENLGFEAF
jgi:hypothetical protein